MSGGVGDGSSDSLDVRAFDREDNPFTWDNVEIAVFKPSTVKDPIGFGSYNKLRRNCSRLLPFVSSDGRVDDDDFTISQGFCHIQGAACRKWTDANKSLVNLPVGLEMEFWQSVDN